MELFLAKVLGIYFIVVGLVVMLRRTSIMPAVNELLRSRSLLLVLGCIELIAGISLVVAYPVVDFSLVGALSLIGWMMTIESILYLALPSRHIRQLMLSFNKKFWYTGGGVAAVAIGSYLAGIGFGLW